MIKLFFLKKIALTKREQLKMFISTIFKKQGLKVSSLNYIFCSDEYLLDINRKHLNHNYYTDIITFNLSNDKVIEGEIYISVDRVRDNAQTLGVTIKEELHRVIFHGALHLCGYKDKKPAHIKEMRKAEDDCLKQYLRK